jgi:hypothetical protein
MLIVALGFDFPIQSTRTELLTRYTCSFLSSTRFLGYITSRRVALLIGNASCRAEPSLDGARLDKIPPPVDNLLGVSTFGTGCILVVPNLLQFIGFIFGNFTFISCSIMKSYRVPER